MSNQFTVKDSGEREEWETGSKRDTRMGKGRFDLIPTGPLRELAVVYEQGAVKYGDSNWKKGQPLQRYIDSAMRHINALVAGETTENHAMQAAWNMFAYRWTLEEIEAGRLPKELDDRPEVEPRFLPEEPVEPVWATDTVQHSKWWVTYDDRFLTGSFGA